MQHYFDEDRDYAAIRAEYRDYPCAMRAFDMLPGLRVLNQPAWETLVTFIISANNNTSRIRRLVLALCDALGEKKEIMGKTVSGFPPAEALRDAEKRASPNGNGYRAPYLIKTARLVADGFPLDETRDMPYGEAHALLTQLSGVGDKVADCVLLFGCGHASAYPVDVWVDRLSKAWLGIEEKTPRATQSAARRLLGENAGILQQYLFHCARLGLMPVGCEVLTNKAIDETKNV